MESSFRGSLRLFRAAGIDVYLHWSWFIVAFLQIGSQRSNDWEYGTIAWKVAEYVSLFAIVLMHEFGHALACRSVGGRAEQILLWPLGGIAFVAPPARPGAMLWSIVAGPLVNLVLVVPTFVLWHWGASRGWETTDPDLYVYVGMMAKINLGLLIFNLLPIYPLDGGQILQALLWYVVGRWNSLLIVSIVGLALGGLAFLASFGAALLFSILPQGAAVGGGFLMLALISAFVGLRSLVTLQQVRGVLALQALPRHVEAACPTCGMGPPRGSFWVCDHCQSRFDLFDHRGKCPACGAWFLNPECPHCHEENHVDRWFATAAGATTPAGTEVIPPPEQG